LISAHSGDFSDLSDLKMSGKSADIHEEISRHCHSVIPLVMALLHRSTCAASHSKRQTINLREFCAD
jgi:hypothetical protein